MKYTQCAFLPTDSFISKIYITFRSHFEIFMDNNKKRKKRRETDSGKRKLLASRIRELKKSSKKVVSEVAAADRRACSPQPSPLDYLVHYFVNEHYVYSACKGAAAVHTDIWETV